jgi:hypothetical protein
MLALAYTPSQALTVLLAQHAELREIMDRCEVLADELDGGLVEPSVVFAAVAELRKTFEVHNHFEEEHLRPVLRETVAFGDVRIDEMVRDHVAEHRLMHDRLENAITDELRSTVDRLRRHLEAEERYFLSSKVLRDDLVVLDGSD